MIGVGAAATPRYVLDQAWTVGAAGKPYGIGLMWCLSPAHARLESDGSQPDVLSSVFGGESVRPPILGRPHRLSRDRGAADLYTLTVKSPLT